MRELFAGEAGDDRGIEWFENWDGGEVVVGNIWGGWLGRLTVDRSEDAVDGLHRTRGCATSIAWARNWKINNRRGGFCFV